jgi:hypothetical protein
LQDEIKAFAYLKEEFMAIENPEDYAQKTREHMKEMIDDLRGDIDMFDDDPQIKALLETSAEVLGGLCNAFEHYEQKSEAAWR